jgi:mono/diheme cytochrome c family protein
MRFSLEAPTWRRHPAFYAAGCLLELLASVGTARSAELAGQAPAKISYNRDIRTILSDNCFYCHGPDKNHRKGKFRLDDSESAIKKGAITPGKPADSTLVDRIYTNDPDDLMPPPETHKKLGDAQKDLLKRWITEGAAYEPFWAYVVPNRPPVPVVKNSDWVRNPIDAYILERCSAGSAST